MNRFYIMLKMNLKLLLRNKGYLAFLIILPIISVVMLNVKNFIKLDSVDEAYRIYEMKDDNETISNITNSKLCIKVYDCSNSELSSYLLKELARTGSYRIYRLRGADMDLKEARENALISANKNVIGAVIYIPSSFETNLFEDKQSNITVFKATNDGRNKILKKNLNENLQSLTSFLKVTGYDKEAVKQLLQTASKNEMKKKIVTVSVGNKIALTAKQQTNRSSIGYSLAFITIGFLFSGIFIAATIIEERQNRVYNRIILSMSSLFKYGLVKFVMVFLTVFIQTGVLAIAIKLFVKTEFGIPFVSFLFFVFCLGLIFNLLSVVIGVLTNNVLTSNYIAFTIWSMSCLIAGLYFPLDAASKWWANAAKLMPQYWVLKASEMLMGGRAGAYQMYLLVVISFLLVIMSVGYMGIRIRRKE